jgi:hypothetical protein
VIKSKIAKKSATFDTLKLSAKTCRPQSFKYLFINSNVCTASTTESSFLTKLNFRKIKDNMESNIFFSPNNTSLITEMNKLEIDLTIKPFQGELVLVSVISLSILIETSVF